MLQISSQFVVILIGVIVAVLSAWGLAVPDRLIALVSSAMHERWGMLVAVIVRLLLGAALILAAPASRFPALFEILGWLAIVAAVVLLVMGRDRMRALIGWFAGMPSAAVRIWLAFGLAFGGFLVYGVL